MKEQIETLGITESNSTVASIDAEMMYPSIKYGLVEKAVLHYSKDLDESDMVTMNTCLEFIKFGMGLTLLTFVDKYYLYDGDVPVNERGLTIGGYESAWLADLVMSFLLETADQSLLDELKYFGIYRDDGLGIFEGKKSIEEVNDWLNKFQSSINQQATNDFLQFTAEVWKVGELNMDNVGKTSVNTDDYFPFLDMELYWGADSELTFNVHIKPNQEIKYLNDGSSHTPGCFKAITMGVCYHLMKLTSINDDNGDKKLDELYPLHFKALSKANLLKEAEIPTLREKKALIEESANDTISADLKK